MSFRNFNVFRLFVFMSKVFITFDYTEIFEKKEEKNTTIYVANYKLRSTNSYNKGTVQKQPTKEYQV